MNEFRDAKGIVRLFDAVLFCLAPNFRVRAVSRLLDVVDGVKSWSPRVDACASHIFSIFFFCRSLAVICHSFFFLSARFLRRIP